MELLYLPPSLVQEIVILDFFFGEDLPCLYRVLDFSEPACGLLHLASFQEAICLTAPSEHLSGLLTCTSQLLLFPDVGEFCLPRLLTGLSLLLCGY